MYAHEIGKMPAEPYGAAVTGGGPARQERRQVVAGRHRADAGTAAAVRDAERLVQVQVGHVPAEQRRRGEPGQRVEVGAVDVDLAARLVHEVGHLR